MPLYVYSIYLKEKNLLRVIACSFLNRSVQCFFLLKLHGCECDSNAQGKTYCLYEIFINYRLDQILGKQGSKAKDVYASKISLASRIVKVERQVNHTAAGIPTIKKPFPG